MCQILAATLHAPTTCSRLVLRSRRRHRFIFFCSLGCSGPGSPAIPAGCISLRPRLPLSQEEVRGWHLPHARLALHSTLGGQAVSGGAAEVWRQYACMRLIQSMRVALASV